MLRGENINLRALEPSDLDVLYNWENDTSIWKVSQTIAPFSKNILAKFPLEIVLVIFSPIWLINSSSICSNRSYTSKK